MFLFPYKKFLALQKVNIYDIQYNHCFRLLFYNRQNHTKNVSEPWTSSRRDTEAIAVLYQILQSEIQKYILPLDEKSEPVSS